MSAESTNRVESPYIWVPRRAEELTPQQKVFVHQVEVLKSMDPFIDQMLNDGDYERPTEFFPSAEIPVNFSQPDALDRLIVFQKDFADVPKVALAVYALGIATEEALPTYAMQLTRNPGIRDETGIDDKGWARWIRKWVKEEDVHGKVMYLAAFLSGRIDMVELDKSIEALIGNGFNQGTSFPYDDLVYTTFQELATFFSHKNVGLIAKKREAKILQKICAKVASDETRHHRFYRDAMGRVFEEDPDGAVIAFARMMKQQITMPAMNITSGEVMSEHTDKPTDLFNNLSYAAQSIGTYTAGQYVEIAMTLINDWRVADLHGLGDEAAQAQEYLLSYFTLEKKARFDEVMEQKLRRMGSISLPWMTEPGVLVPSEPEVTLRAAFAKNK